MKKTLIIGHRNPDTDTVVSALIAEDYFKNVLKMDVKACRAGDMNSETRFVLDSFAVEPPALLKNLKDDDDVILVDHNEEGQFADDLKHSHVIGIIDHHKTILATEKPLFIRIEPVGSTSSVLAKMYQESGKKISKKIAKLVLAGILSDTLNLSGPTTTDYDKKIAREMNKIAKLDLKKFVSKMFSAKSSLKGISAETVVGQDYKIFEMGKKKVGIGVWETTDPESVNPMKEKIKRSIADKKNKDKVDHIFFFVADIMKQNSVIYTISPEDEKLAEKVFGAKIKDGEAFLSGVISRKKQIVPPLMQELSK